METKVCTKCGIEKELSEFHFRKDSGKYRNECKECRKSISKEYRNKNIDSIRDREKKYSKEHREDRILYLKKYRVKNKELISFKKSEKYKETIKNNPDYNKEKHLRYKDSHNEYCKKWYAKNKEKSRENKRKWAKTENGKICRKRNVMRRRKESTITKSQLKELKQKSNNKCYWCGCNIKNEYHFDHYVPLAKGGTNCIENLVLSCPPCNLNKKAKDPHEFAMSLGRLL